MAERTERTVLTHLIEICHDAERGFRAASEFVHDPTLKSLFLDLAAQRATFAADLAPYLHRVGGQDVADGTTAGALHRRWMGIRDTVSGHNDHATIMEAARGEHIALSAYTEAIQNMLSPMVREVVEEQHAGLQRASERIRVFETIQA